MVHIINLAAQQILSHLDVIPAKDNENKTNISMSTKSISMAFSPAWNIIQKIQGSNKLWNCFKAQTSAAKLPSLKLILDMRVQHVLC